VERRGPRSRSIPAPVSILINQYEAQDRTSGGRWNGPANVTFRRPLALTSESTRLSAEPAGIISGFDRYPQNTMEAERINLIAKRLDDVDSRAAELRRYL
jgi:hypothetical protein